MHRSEEALRIIRKRNLAQEAVINSDMGNALELIVTGTTTAVDLVDLLRAEGFEDVFSFAQSRLSLGDVFLTATGRSLRDADMAGLASRDVKEAKREQLN